MKKNNCILSNELLAKLAFARGEIDEFFYGDFEKYERTADDRIIVTSKEGYTAPVRDWKKGKFMSAGEIWGLAYWAYLKALNDWKRETD